MRGVIQVRCQRPWPAAGASRDHRFEVAVEGHRVAVLAHQPRQVVGDVQVVEEQHRALRRRPPFQRRHVRQRIEPAPIGGEQGRQRQFVHDAGKAVGRDRARVRDRAAHSPAPAIRASTAARDWARRRCAPAPAPRRARAPSARACRPGSRGTARRGARRGSDAVGGQAQALGFEGHGGSGIPAVHKPGSPAFSKHACG